MTIKSKKIIYWFLDVMYAVIFGAIIGMGFGFDISEKLKKYFD